MFKNNMLLTCFKYLIEKKFFKSILNMNKPNYN